MLLFKEIVSFSKKICWYFWLKFVKFQLPTVCVYCNHFCNTLINLHGFTNQLYNQLVSLKTTCLFNFEIIEFFCICFIQLFQIWQHVVPFNIHLFNKPHSQGGFNNPCSIYWNSNMTPRLEGQNCRFLTTLLSHNSQEWLEHKENQTKYRKMTRRPHSHVRILIYRTWAIAVYAYNRFKFSPVFIYIYIYIYI